MSTDELVGHDTVLAVISDAITATADRGTALLLDGEAGIGKTACLLAAGAMARQSDYLVLQTAGHEAEANLAFAGLHRLIRPLLGSTDGLPDVQRRALLSAFGLADDGRADRFVVSIATVNLLRQMSERRPLLITADDVQWLDEQTQHVLAFAARRVDHRLVIVAASSSAPTVPGLRDAFRELRIDRLADSTARRLLARSAPGLAPAQCQWVLSHALGNPLALIELAKSPAPVDTIEFGPALSCPSLSPALERAFAGRLYNLATSDRDVVLVAAVAFDASLPEVLAATARITGHGMTPAALEPAQALGLLRFDEKRVTFTHPLVKAAIVQAEPISRRQSAHRALGAVITMNSSRRAWHRALGAAGYDEAIAEELEATTADSVRRGDTAAAVTALERAAQLSTASVDRGRRLVLAARHAARLGQRDAMVRLLAAADSSGLSEFDRVRAELLRENFGGVVIADSNRVMQLCRVARRAIAVGETELALDLADAAVRRRCAAPVDAAALSEMDSLAQHLFGTSSSARAVTVLALADPVIHGRAVLSRLAETDESRLTDGDELSAYGIAARAVGHYTVAARFFDRAEAPLRERGLLAPLARNLCVVADLRLDLGEWDRAAAALDGFAALSVESMSASHRATALATTAKIAALRGDTATALEVVSEIELSPAARSGSRYLARAQIVRGIAYISAGKHADAYAALSRVFEPDDPSHHFREQFDAVAYLAESAAHCGRHDEAGDVIERMQLIAEVAGAPVLLTQLRYARALLAPDAAAELLFLAGLASDVASSPWQRARLQLAYGSWLRRQQRVTQSRGPLQAALTTLRQLGAAKWAQEALDELEAGGARTERDKAVSVSNPLSVQESKIARLASQGMSNREIGQRLSISPRTVSSHLYRIFPKLGISTRSQLASRLDERHSVSGSV